MPIPSPTDVTYTPGTVPAWASAVQATVIAAVTTGWAFGTQRTKEVSFTAAQFNIPGGVFNAQHYAKIDMLIAEFRAAGWGVELTDTAANAQGGITGFTLTFERWPQ